MHHCPVSLKAHADAPLSSVPGGPCRCTTVQCPWRPVQMHHCSVSLEAHLSVAKAGYRFSGAAVPCSGVQGMYKLHAAAFALLPQYYSTANY